MPFAKLFNEKDCENFLEYFQPFYISSNDVQFFDFYNKKIIDFDPSLSNNYSFFFLIFNKNDMKYQKLIEKDKDLLKTYKINELTYYLSQLFDTVSKLPIFNSVPENINTIQDFFNIYFVQKGSAEGIEKKRKLFDSFFNYPELDLANDFDEVMNSFISLENSDFEQLNSLCSKSCIINLILEKAIDNTKFILQSSLFKLKDATKFAYQDYTKNPKLLETDYDKLCNDHLQMIFPEIKKKILFKEMISQNGLNLTNFIKRRKMKNNHPILDELESKFNSFFSDINAFNKYIDGRIKIKYNTSSGKFDKNAYLLRNILSYPHNYFNCIQNDIQIDHNFIDSLNNAHSEIYPKIDMNISITISDVIIGAFLEDSILRKYDVLSTAFAMITNDINSHYPKNINNSIVREDFGPVFTAILMRINPPKLLTNIVLMIDLIENLPLLDIFDGFSPTINSCLNDIYDYFVANNPNVIDKESLFLYKD